MNPHRREIAEIIAGFCEPSPKDGPATLGCWAASIRKADKILALLPPAALTPDGGWLFATSLFASRVTALSVPGAGPDGLQRIEVTLDDGTSVIVHGVNVQAAWQALADAAETMKAAAQPAPFQTAYTAGERDREKPE